MSEPTKRTSRGIKGISIDIGGEILIVPPLNFRQLEQHAETLASFSHWDKLPNPYMEMPKALPIILDAIRRNYPDYTEEEANNNVDMGNYREIFEAIMGVSGITKELVSRGTDTIKGGDAPVEVKPRIM
jgi:hypothetical protein